jgi:hypothetical protein
VDIDVLRRLEDRILGDVPGFKVAFKNQSRLMKVLGFLTTPFNPRFLTDFTTTLGKTVYFPTREEYETDVAGSFKTLSHEYVHLWDGKSWWFSPAYAFPQLLAVLPFLLFGVLAWPHSWLLLLPVAGYALAAWATRKSLIAFWVILGLGALGTFGLSIWLTGWATLALIAGLMCLAPWPSPGRTKAELRGYTMTIAVALWQGSTFTSERREHLVGHFVGPGYYFMSWRRAVIEKEIDAAIEHVTNGGVPEGPPFLAVRELLAEHGLLRR